MRILEGTISEKLTWRVCVMLEPGMLLGKMWQLGSLLAKANNGELISVVMVHDESETSLTAGREMVARLQEVLPDRLKSYTVLALSHGDYEEGIEEFAREVEVDMVLARIEDANLKRLNHVNCTVGVVRGDIQLPDEETAVPDKEEIGRILVPTVGGPNSIHALQMLLPLNIKSEITALYVAPDYLGDNEEALGRARLRQTLQFIGAEGKIKPKLITAPSAIEGIVEEASHDYDLVVLGASQEGPIDRALFGDVPGAVVRESKKATLIIRSPKSRVSGAVLTLGWYLQRMFPPIRLNQRTEAYVRIRRGARADVGYYLLIACSAIIACFGLMLNSGAVVIGAMLVAPLMYPIVSTGLAIVQGDPRFIKLSLTSSLRGVFLAIGVSMIVGLLNIGEPLTSELAARTQPNLLDLGVAIFSGIAGAYAVCHSDAAGALPGVAIAAALVPPLGTAGITFSMGLYPESFGALLLFTTNFVAMSVATASVFLVLGFRPTLTKKDRRALQARSVRVAVSLLLLVAGVLGYSTYRLASEASVESRIRDVTNQAILEYIHEDAELVDYRVVDLRGGVLQLQATVHSPNDLQSATVLELQDGIEAELARVGIVNRVSLKLTLIEVKILEPEAATPVFKTDLSEP